MIERTTDDTITIADVPEAADVHEPSAASFGAASLEQPAAEPTMSGTIVARSAYDTMMSVAARRSIYNARLLRENPDVVKALRAVAAWIVAFCESKALGPNEVDVTWSMTREGIIVLHIEEKQGVDY